MTPTAEALLELGRLSLALGRTERLTKHEDGERFESVATHTVMLAWCALSLNEALEFRLDPAEIARFALCHDAPEAICGDTGTLRISAQERAAKAEREEAATSEIETRTVGLSWLGRSIRDYERLKSGGRAGTGEGSVLATAKAAAFVHAVDKLMPKLTHVLNGGVTLFDSGIDREELAALLDCQRGDILGTLPRRIALPLVELQIELSELTLALPLEPHP